MATHLSIALHVCPNMGGGGGNSQGKQGQHKPLCCPCFPWLLARGSKDHTKHLTLQFCHSPIHTHNLTVHLCAALSLFFPKEIEIKPQTFWLVDDPSYLLSHYSRLVYCQQHSKVSSTAMVPLTCDCIVKL